jgi:hypothetical protein
MLLDDGDIFIGFLWIIDLGVGLIFFIFILHFSSFLYQKTILDLTTKNFLLLNGILFFSISFLYVIYTPVTNDFNWQLQKSWFFLISWYDYYDLYFSYTISDLTLLRELYFYNNGFEFFLINFMLFYGILSSVCFVFLLKRIFLFLNFSQIQNLTLLTEMNVNFFIRNQNFIKQQFASTGVRVWAKKKINFL